MIDRNMINSAAALSRLEEEEKQHEIAMILKEINSPTNQNLQKLINQNNRQIAQDEAKIELLSEQNKKLQLQLDMAIKNERIAKKGVIISRIISGISIAIALASLFVAIFK